MAVTHAGVFVQGPNFTPVTFTNSDSANTKKTLVTAGANGSKVVAVPSTSTDTSARVSQLWITRSATSYLACSASITALAGSDGSTAAVDAFHSLNSTPIIPTDNDGQKYILLMSGDTLDVSLTTQVTSGKHVDFVPVAADF